MHAFFSSFKLKCSPQLHIPVPIRPSLSYILITCAVLGGCFLYGNLVTPQDSNNFESYTTQLFVQEISGNTLNLHYTLENYEAYGIIDPPTTFGTFATSSMNSAIAIENQMSLLSTFAYESLTEEDQITYDVIQDYLTIAEMGTAYTLFYEPLSPYTGLHTQLPILLAEYTLTSEEDVITYLELLETLPTYFQSLLAFEQAKADAGLFMSNTQLDAVLEDCYAFIQMDENYLVSTFDTRISEIALQTSGSNGNPTIDFSANATSDPAPDASANATSDPTTAYSARNSTIIQESVIPAYEALAEGLSELRDTGTNAQGLCYYENGRNYYAYLIRANTGSSRTIPELQVLIENQLLEDLLNLQEASLEIGSDGLQTPVIEGTSEEILLDLESSLSRLFPEPADVSVTVNDVPEELEAFLSPAFYLIPTLDNTFDNTIYINNSYMTDDVTRYTTLAHEGFPGHLYQTTYFAETDPAPIRSILSYGGYVEGWATYVEMCSYYLGAIDSPTDELLQKSASLNLGLYAYVDIGIHYEGWSLTDVIDYFNTYGINDSETIIKIYDLIVATPSNYLKYYIGYLEFLELKKECIALWGDEFSQIRFHEAVLEVGPVSFDILRKYVLK